MQANHCKVCNNPNSAESEFCGECGTRLYGSSPSTTVGKADLSKTHLRVTDRSSSETKPNPENATLQNTLEVTPSQPRSSEPQSPKKSKKILYTILVTVTLLCIIAFSIYKIVDNYNFTHSPSGLINSYCQFLSSPGTYADAYKLLSDEHTNKPDITQAQFIDGVKEAEIVQCKASNATILNVYEASASIVFSYIHQSPFIQSYALFRKTLDGSWLIDTSAAFFRFVGY
jgi:hypothetical protein